MVEGLRVFRCGLGFRGFGGGGLVQGLGFRVISPLRGLGFRGLAGGGGGGVRRDWGFRAITSAWFWGLGL